jgi:hypothetical protein
MGDDEADLVDVADHGEQRLVLADAGDRGAEPVGRERGEGGFLTPDRGSRRLMAGGRAGAQQLVEQAGTSAMAKAAVCRLEQMSVIDAFRIVFTAMSEATMTALVTGPPAGSARRPPSASLASRGPS